MAQSSKTPITKICQACGKQFTFTPNGSLIERVTRKFCTIKCARKSVGRKDSLYTQKFKDRKNSLKNDPTYTWGHLRNIDKNGRILKRKDKQLGL